MRAFLPVALVACLSSAAAGQADKSPETVALEERGFPVGYTCDDVWGEVEDAPTWLAGQLRGVMASDICDNAEMVCTSGQMIADYFNATPPSDSLAWVDHATDIDRRTIYGMPVLVEGAAWTVGRMNSSNEDWQRYGGTEADREAYIELLTAPAIEIDQSTIGGSYRCRTFSPSIGDTFMIVYDWFDCVISRDREAILIDKLTGSIRYRGQIFSDQGLDHAFLGVWYHWSGGHCPDTPPYGPDPERNVAGSFARIDEQRYRWVLRDNPGSQQLNIIELVAR